MPLLNIAQNQVAGSMGKLGQYPERGMIARKAVKLEAERSAAQRKNMSRIVCKFGGSSVADAVQFKKIKAIV